MHNLNVIFFFLCFLGVGFLVFLIFQPFLTATLVAAVLASLFYAPYRWLLLKTNGWAILSASLVMTLIALLVIFPVFLVSSMTLSEITRLLGGVSGEAMSFPVVTESIEMKIFQIPIIGHFLESQEFRLQNVFADLSGTGDAMLGFLQTLYGGISQFIFWIFMMLFALFYFFVDGERAVHFLKRMSPLHDDADDEIMRDFVSTSRAILKGTIIIAFVQGFLGGLAFLFVGLPSPVVWGVVMGFLSLIPMLGTGIVWFPAALWLLFSGDIWQGIFLLSFGFAAISTIDNILRPKLVGRDTQIHPLLILFSTLGGLAFFGLAGFLIGPIIVSLFVALVRIYSREFKQQIDAFNKPFHRV